MPAREAASHLLMLALLAATFAWAETRPGPGPLGLVGAVAAFHAAVVGPSCGVHGVGGLRALAFGLPALAAASYGTGALAPAVLLLALAGLAGASSRALGRFYLPLMTLLFLAPYALSYLALEFGAGEAVPSWRRLSPGAASFHVAGGAWPPAACAVALLVAPAAWIARRPARR